MTEQDEHSSDDWKSIGAKNEELSFSERMKERLGITPYQWFIIETLLIVLPYPLFVAAYFLLSPPELPFLAVTLLYSLIAMFVGFGNFGPHAR